MADSRRPARQHDAAEYKHVILGLIFLKYISDAFEAQHAMLEAEKDQGADPEDLDEYRALNIFWVPPEARWSHLKAQAKQSTSGQLVDDAMAGIERDNPSLKADYILANPPFNVSDWRGEEDDGEPFAEKMWRLTAQLCEQQAEAWRLDEAIWKNLKGLGYDA
jgi:type I restriction-modification system DNA methylase subunit